MAVRQILPPLPNLNGTVQGANRDRQRLPKSPAQQFVEEAEKPIVKEPGRPRRKVGSEAALAAEPVVPGVGGAPAVTTGLRGEDVTTAGGAGTLKQPAPPVAPEDEVTAESVKQRLVEVQKELQKQRVLFKNVITPEGRRQSGLLEQEEKLLNEQLKAIQEKEAVQTNLDVLRRERTTTTIPSRQRVLDEEIARQEAALSGAEEKVTTATAPAAVPEPGETGAGVTDTEPAGTPEQLIRDYQLAIDEANKWAFSIPDNPEDVEKLVTNLALLSPPADYDVTTGEWTTTEPTTQQQTQLSWYLATRAKLTEQLEVAQQYAIGAQELNLEQQRLDFNTAQVDRYKQTGEVNNLVQAEFARQESELKLNNLQAAIMPLQIMLSLFNNPGAIPAMKAMGLLDQFSAVTGMDLSKFGDKKMSTAEVTALLPSAQDFSKMSEGERTEMLWRIAILAGWTPQELAEFIARSAPASPGVTAGGAGGRPR